MRLVSVARLLVATVALALSGGPAAAQAATTTLGFDLAPDGKAATPGTPVYAQYPGVRFAADKAPDAPTIQQPAAATATSSPYVLIAGGACDVVNLNCPAHVLEATLDDGPTQVSLLAGLDDQKPPKDGVWANLRAFDADGAAVASSGDILLGADIATALSVTASKGAKAPIARVRLDVGQGTDSHDSPDPNTTLARRAIIDDLVVVRPDAPQPPPSPPTVTLTAPAPGRYGRGDVFRAQGIATGGRAITKVCVAVDALPDATCSGTPPGADGAFDLAVSAVAPGTHTVQVLAVDSAGATASAAVTVTVTLNNVRADWMEVTQGTQYYPSRDHDLRHLPFPDGDVAQTLIYGGVRLGENVPTVVRALVTLPFARSEDLGRVPPATLYGYEERAGGGLVPLGAGVAPLRSPTRLPPGPNGVSDAQVAGRLYEFQVPTAWTAGGRTIRLVVDADPGPFPVIAQDRLLELDDAVAVTGVTFNRMNRMIVSPVELIRAGSPRLGSAVPFIEPLVRALPGRAIGVSWRSTIDVTGYTPDTCFSLTASACAASFAGRNDGELADRFEDWYDDSSFYGVPIGIGPMVINGMTQDGTYAVATSNRRPLTSVAHEFTHVLGRAHASGSCGGGSGGQTGVSWPPDQLGFLNGIALDRRPQPNPAAPAFTVVQPGSSLPTRPFGTYDYMSYCALSGNGDPNSALSPRNWDSISYDLRPGGSLAYTSGVNYGEDARRVPPAFAPQVVGSRAATTDRATGARVRVRLQVEPDGSAARVRNVAPTAAPPSPGGDPQSAFTIQTVGADGRVLASAAATITTGHGDAPSGALAVASAQAVVGSVGATEVRVLASDGHVVAQRLRSAHPPRVRIVSPARGDRLPLGATVSWNAADADGDALRASVQTSDDGRRWRTVADGLASSRFTLPPGAFAGSDTGHLRVLVSDGFDMAGSAVDALRTSGAPAVVRIDGPARVRMRSDGVLSLTGGAALEVGTAVADHALAWTVDGRAAGRGAGLDVRGLTPGRHTVVLTARPRGARRGHAHVTVAVTKVALRFTQLQELGRTRGTSGRVRVATSERARVRDARGRKVVVGPVTRTVRLRVAAKAKTLRVTAQTADGRRVTRTIALRRSR